MGKASDNTWFGIFANLIAAQDWYIKNNLMASDVSLKCKAAGGVADLFFMMEGEP
jgi:hypothetical protein